jgi:hypothetical protein
MSAAKLYVERLNHGVALPLNLRYSNLTRSEQGNFKVTRCVVTIKSPSP